MGKCKKRTLNKPILENSLTRSHAVSIVVNQIKKNELNNEGKNLLTLFGITPEELTEAGASYEEVLILKRFMILNSI
ncbi:hypothetical protein IJG14_07055 [bacterium]|nr:hypothetical protein [bacterium]